MNFTASDIIDSYSRAQAIEDGVLVDVTATAREAGIKYPTAITRAAYEKYVAWTAEDNERKGALQDESGRLWDVLSMLRFAALRSGGGSRLDYTLYVVPREGPSVTAALVQLKSICGPGDTAAPVLTVMLPEED